MKKQKEKNQGLTDRLANIIKDRFKKNNSEFARKAGITPQTLKSIMNRGTAPEVDTFLKLATASNMTMEELWTGHDPYGLDSNKRELLRLWDNALPECQKGAVEVLRAGQ